MRPWIDRYLEAFRHVSTGRLVLSRQRKVIADLKEHGRSTKQSEEILETFERSQAIFESDLGKIEKERTSHRLFQFGVLHRPRADRGVLAPKL